jgi:hypothetical protein
MATSPLLEAGETMIVAQGLITISKSSRKIADRVTPN